MTEEVDHNALRFYLLGLRTISDDSGFAEWLRYALTDEAYYEEHLGRAKAYVTGYNHGWQEAQEKRGN